jgi:hypothetical protein
MAKIGKHPDSSEPLRPIQSGGLGANTGNDQPSPSAEAGTFGHSFLALKERLRDGYPGGAEASYAGTFNSEIASMEIRTDIFEACAHHTEFVANCEKCGRRPGNNLSMLTGRGDGVYSGITYSYSTEEMDEEERIAEHLASAYLFDQDIAFAMTLAQNGWSNPEGLFIQLAMEYRELQGSVAGEFYTGDYGFTVSDESAEPGSADAVVNHWGSDNKSYVVVVFHEPIDASKMYYSSSAGDPVVDANGNLKTPVRPRVVLIIEKELAVATFGDFSDFPAVPWAEQPHLWMNMTVASNMSRDNGINTMVNDGIYWNGVASRQAQVSPEDFWINKEYRMQALGYFLQGALLGDESCHERARSVLLGSGPSPLTMGEVELALRARAQRFDEKARTLVESLLA